MKTLILALALALTSSLVTATAVAAAVPGDSMREPARIELPYRSNALSLAGATATPQEDALAGCPVELDSTLWLRPDGPLPSALRVAATGDDLWVALLLDRGSGPASLACKPSTEGLAEITWSAIGADDQLLVMVGRSRGTDGDITSFRAESVPPNTFNVFVEQTGHSTPPTSGIATVAITSRCTYPELITIDATLSQDRGIGTIHGTRSARVMCGSAHQLVIPASNARFLPGPARITATYTSGDDRLTVVMPIATNKQITLTPALLADERVRA